MTKKLIIFGAAEIASLAKFYFMHDSNYDVVAFTVDDQYVEADCFDGLPVVPFSEMGVKYPSQEFDMHVALSYQKFNQLREEKYFQAKKAGYHLATYVSTKATTWPDLCVGDNCFILEDQTIQPTVKIGNNVMLWSGNHIGHGTVIGDHTYLASHVVISGHCQIGQRCFIGVNASFRDFLKVGDDVFVGMDSSVSKDLESGSMVLSAQSEFFDPGDRKAQRIKKIYFKS